jgi:predicted CXXCH cytochrome family protein
MFIYLPGEAGARYMPNGIFKSKHNLSATGPGPIKAVSETRVCVFCHTPHDARPAAPLWNRELPNGNAYQLYGSSTMKNRNMDQPRGPSRLCLSCHDGSIALGAVRSEEKDITMTDRGVPISKLPPEHAANLTTDLSDDHPISFAYSKKLFAAARGKLAFPGSIDKRVKLFNGRIECTTCHEAHDNKFGKFLAKSNANARLCLTCHKLDYWANKPGILEKSIHKTSNKSWKGFDENPLARASYLADGSEARGKLTVELNGCGNCHATHSAGGKERLLVYHDEEDNCLQCHNGNVGSKDIESEFEKEFIHPIYDTAGVHDPQGDMRKARRHVECVDCHDHHAVRSGSHIMAKDGNLASRNLLGVWGVEPDYSAPLKPAAGMQRLSRPRYSVVDSAEREYQICLKCHSSYAFGGSPPSGYTDQGKEFNAYNYSFHPVVEPGDNEFCNSDTMEPPWNQGLDEHNTMYCSDCHGSDDPDSPKGPHGSDNPYLLKAAGPGDSFDDLCLMCHKEEVYVDGARGSRFEAHGNREHHFDRKDNPLGCMACHGGGVGDNEDNPGNIHGTNYRWPDHQGNPGLNSDNLLVGGYITALYKDGNRNTCMAGSNASATGCHTAPQSWP